jgi:hypothetical protein
METILCSCLQEQAERPCRNKGRDFPINSTKERKSGRNRINWDFAPRARHIHQPSGQTWPWTLVSLPHPLPTMNLCTDDSGCYLLVPHLPVSRNASCQCGMYPHLLLNSTCQIPAHFERFCLKVPKYSDIKNVFLLCTPAKMRWSKSPVLQGLPKLAVHQAVWLIIINYIDSRNPLKPSELGSWVDAQGSSFSTASQVILCCRFLLSVFQNHCS